MNSISFEEYEEFGYSLIPKDEFTRYSIKATLTAGKYTRDFDKDDLSENNRRGIYELADLFFSDFNQINKPVMSFSNEGYSETYGLPSNANIQSAEDKAYEIIRIYFSRDQLFRGV